MFNWIRNTTLIRRIINHFKEFPYIWVLLFLLLLLACMDWSCSVTLIGCILALLTALMMIRPMNAVYGLMGTSGSIPMFFFNFLIITVLFAGVYYGAFFKNAGISFDSDQPQIDFQLYAVDKAQEGPTRILIKRDTMFFEHQLDTITFQESIVHVTRDTLHYQKVSFWQVWRSSIQTTLTQSPSDLLNAATAHNPSLDKPKTPLFAQKTTLFEWILIFHILISWIFFGVFISLLYNKFRYES